MAEAGWIQRFQKRPHARLSLFCFPHAGGAAQAFRSWHKDLPDWIDVCSMQPPGRWNRRSEPLLRRVSQLASSAALAIRADADSCPFAVFGHSLGALVAFETVRELRRSAGPSPTHLIVSSRSAPEVAIDLSVGGVPLHQLDEPTFVSELSRRYAGGIQQALLDEPELLRMMLPIARADIEAFETYNYEAEPPLDTPLIAVGSRADSMVSEATLAGWRKQTAREFELVMFEGGHFYLQNWQREVLGAFAERLSQTRVSR